MNIDKKDFCEEIKVKVHRYIQYGVWFNFSSLYTKENIGNKLFLTILKLHP